MAVGEQPQLGRSSRQELMSYPWYPNQPDHNDTSHGNNNEHCAGLWNPGYYYDTFKKDPSNKEAKQSKHSFNDFPCDALHYFICEKTDPPPLSLQHCKDLQTNPSVSETEDSADTTTSDPTKDSTSVEENTSKETHASEKRHATPDRSVTLITIRKNKKSSRRE